MGSILGQGTNSTCCMVWPKIKKGLIKELRVDAGSGILVVAVSFHLRVRSFLQWYFKEYHYSFFQNGRLSSVAPLSPWCLKLFQLHFYLSWFLCKQRGSATSRCKGFRVLGCGEAAFCLDASPFWPMHGSGFRSWAMKLTMALLIPSPCCMWSLRMCYLQQKSLECFSQHVLGTSVPAHSFLWTSSYLTLSPAYHNLGKCVLCKLEESCPIVLLLPNKQAQQLSRIQKEACLFIHWSIICNVMLLSSVWQGYIHIVFFRFFPTIVIGYYRILNIVPCTI